jgi:hypothetical protein
MERDGEVIFCSSDRNSIDDSSRENIGVDRLVLSCNGFFSNVSSTRAFFIELNRNKHVTG